MLNSKDYTGQLTERGAKQRDKGIKEDSQNIHKVRMGETNWNFLHVSKKISLGLLGASIYLGSGFLSSLKDLD